MKPDELGPALLESRNLNNRIAWLIFVFMLVVVVVVVIAIANAVTLSLSKSLS